MLEWYSRIHGFTAVFLRYFNACGATASHGEDHEPETHLIPIVLRAAMGQRKAVTIHGGDYPTPDGTCVRDYIHIVDLARAHVLGLRCAKTEAFNLGTGRGYSVREVLDTAREVTGRRIPARIGPRRRGDPPRLVASPEKANRSLKWKPRASDLETIIRSAWEWHQAHPRGYGGRKPGAAGRT
jgi:UDP-glucose 4-epimerase